MDFLAEYRKKHPKLKGAEVMRAAGVEYRKKQGKKAAPKKTQKVEKNHHILTVCSVHY